MPEPLLSAFLAACRSGALPAFLQQRPGLARRYARRLLAPLHRVAGDAVPADALAPQGWELLLRALLAQMRPDARPGLDDIDSAHWLRPSNEWRALLALACHHGALQVPSMPGVYRPRPHEAPAEQLCGLWDVVPSTVYRSVDRGRRALQQLLEQALDEGPALLHRERALQHEVYRMLGLADADARAAWHRAQAARAALAGTDAVWHLLHAGDSQGFIDGLQRHAVALARHPDTDELLHQARGLTLDHQAGVQLALAEAGLWRLRGDGAAECAACERALRLAHLAGDTVLLGRAYGALGRYHELRDPPRAFACFQDSVDHLGRAGVPDPAKAADPALVEEFANTLVHLAWWYLLHNDPRAGPLLERAQAVHDQSPRAAQAQALLAQTWGEYWRRSGQLGRALEHKYRALHLYQQLDDPQGQLKTYGNLSLIHGEAKDFARAIECSQQALAIASRFTVEPETVASTHLNLGAAYFWQNRWDPAIGHYEQALQIASAYGLGVVVGRAHYNLAEAYYKRFQALDLPEDELQGDAHAAAAMAIWSQPGYAAAAEATRQLKQDLLGPRSEDSTDRLLPAEFAAHFPELLAVQRQRAALALPLGPKEQAAAHLAIAQAYLKVSTKERDAAAELIARHGLAQHFQAEFDHLSDTFSLARSRRQQTMDQWRLEAGDLLPIDRRAAVLDHLLRDGAIGKSAYAALCGVSLATASKQLGALARRGLLAQVGSGPRTRYRLPDG